MGRIPKKESERKTEHLLIRLTKELKEQFQKKCDDELIEMSIKARQLIARDLKSIEK